MALVCSKCSTENADGALVCRHCGAALPPPAGWSRSLLPEDDHFDPLSAPTLVMQHTAPAALEPIEDSAVPRPRGDGGGGGGSRRLLLGLAGVVAFAAALAWMLRPAETVSTSPAPAAVAPAASAAAAMSAAPAASVVHATVVATPASAPAAMPVASAVRAGPVAPAASAVSMAAPASAADGRKRIPEPVARKRALSAPPAASSTAMPAAAPPAPEPVAAPATVAERPKPVAELCAAGNLITRGFCEQRECRRSEHANDPVCAKLKDAEQRRLFQQ